MTAAEDTIPTGRHYGMDWLRIAAFGLLIFYHIGMVFVWWDWHIKAPVTPDWVSIPMLATNAWRLSLLFVVSGFASAALLAKLGSPGAFFGSRNARLLIPLIFGIIFIVPAQPWIELTFKHGYSHGFWHFWWEDYFRFGALEGITLPTWQHLWFVVYLWAYTAALVVLLWVIPSAIRTKTAAVVEKILSGPLPILLPILYFATRSFVLFPGAGETHALVDDLAAHAVYFPCFMFGLLLQRSAALWASIRRWWPLAVALALAGYGMIVIGELIWPGDTVAPSWVGLPFGFARICQGWATIIALVGFADRYMNRDFPVRKMLNEAVFPFYIIHQTLIVVAAWWLLERGVEGTLLFFGLVAFTVAGCWIFYRLGREIPGLRILIGLKGWRPVRP